MTFLATTLAATLTAMQAPPSEYCSIWIGPAGERLSPVGMQKVRDDLMRKVRSARVEDMSYGGSAKEMAARKAKQEQEDRNHEERLAKMKAELARYYCSQGERG